VITGFRRAALIPLLAAIVAGCQATPSPAPTSTSPPTVAPATTPPSPSRQPSASEPPSSGPSASGRPALEVTGSAGQLAPGRYTHEGFEPRITFELDGSWHSVNAYQGFFDVQQDIGSLDVIAVQFGLPTLVAAGPLTATSITTAEAAVATLKANDRLKTVESSSSQIGGLTGFQITVENSADHSDLTPVVRVTPGVLQIAPGRRLWCAFFDTPQGVLAIMVGGSVASWDEALAAAEPVLESVTIGE
jgi:hypothetical protein